MSDKFEFTEASRTHVKPLIGIFSESGCGKTFSALLLARGFVGPKGKIGMIDTESGRGSLYADVASVAPYRTLDFDQPFSPARYIAAIDAAEAQGFDILIVDSMSHEWEGIGGVLDMAGDNEQRSGKPGLHNWKTPKLEHAKMVQRLLRSKLPVIVCVRAKYKSRQVKVDGKTQIIKDEATSPIQAEDFIFEMTAHMEVLQNHTIIVTKASHPTLRECFPADKSEPIGIKHGELLAKWCATPGQSPAAKTTTAATGDLKKLKKELWELTKAKHNGDPKALEQWLWDESILGDTETLEAAGPARLVQIITQTKTKLDQPMI